MYHAVFVLLAVALFWASADGAETARQILDRSRVLEETTRRWTDRHQQMRMTLIDARDTRSLRELDLYERKDGDGGRKMITFIASPANLKGTALLAFTYRDHAPKQWLYQPSYPRVRVVGSGLRDESFAGTDLSYRDLELLAEMPSWREEDATSRLRGEETLDGAPCHVIELTPQREDIDYRYVVLWLGRDDLIPRQMDLHRQAPSVWGPGGSPGPDKRVRQRAVRLVATIPVAHEIIVETPARETRTEIEIVGVQFDRGIGEDFFSQRRLQLGNR